MIVVVLNSSAHNDSYEKVVIGLAMPLFVGNSSEGHSSGFLSVLRAASQPVLLTRRARERRRRLLYKYLFLSFSCLALRQSSPTHRICLIQPAAAQEDVVVVVAALRVAGRSRRHRGEGRRNDGRMGRS